MTDKLPPNLLKLFAPRPPLPYIPPLDRDPNKRKGAQISGIAQYFDQLKNHDPDYVPWKSIAERKKERMEAKKKAAAEAVEQGLTTWNPENDEKVAGDPFCILFVSRLSYNVTEEDLMREFDLYGPIKNIRLIRDQENKSRGYAFIEFEREKDMRAAYKDADGLKLDGRRILVDVERGRTVKGWKPRRLGGGLGSTRTGSADQNARSSGRDDSSSGGDRYRDRGGGAHGYNRFNGGSSRREHGFNERRRGKSRSRSRSPRGYRDHDRDHAGGRGRDRSRDRYDRGPRRDR